MTMFAHYMDNELNITTVVFQTHGASCSLKSVKVCHIYMLLYDDIYEIFILDCCLMRRHCGIFYKGERYNCARDHASLHHIFV